MCVFIAAYFGLGLVAGLLAGLLGVGGGLVIVPALLWMWGLSSGIPPEIAPHLALGTSLASILFTSAASVRAHHSRGAVDWPIARRMAVGALAGTFAGSLLAARASATTLQWLFAGFACYVSVQMWLGFKPAAHRAPPQAARAGAAGVIVGAVSSGAGVAGGTLTVPFLLWHNIPAHRAVATASAVGIPVALAGAVGYACGGWGASGLPSFSLGFVYLPALAAIVAGSVLTAPLGARLSHGLPAARLRQGFAAFLGVVALHMLWKTLGYA